MIIYAKYLKLNSVSWPTVIKYSDLNSRVKKLVQKIIAVTVYKRNTLFEQNVFPHTTWGKIVCVSQQQMYHFENEIQKIL